jgi:beta-lactamase regulating signal transducer with metallopeptidase domain
MSATAAGLWVLRVLAGGGLVLLLARLVMGRVREPALRQRLGETALAAGLLLAALSLAPAWLLLPVPADSPPPPPAPTPIAAPATAPPGPAVGEAPPEAQAWADLPDVAADAEAPRAAEPAPAPPVPAPPAPAPFWTAERVVAALVVAYAVVAGLLLLRWLLAHALLFRLLRQATPAPPRVAAIFDELAPARRPRLLCSERARVPFSHGLWRPTVVLPAALAETAPAEVLRWALAHELTHLERRDGLACLLLGLGQVLFFPLPWFWWLGRQVRLCQEYVADAAACAAGGRPEDYAEFLLAWAEAPPPPAGVTGVSGPVSDLFRRITMLLQSPAPARRCPRRWSLLAGAAGLSLAVLAAGLGVYAPAAPLPDKPAEKKDEPKQAQPKPDQPGKDEPKKDEPKKDDRPMNFLELQEQFQRDLMQAQADLQKAIREAQEQFQQNMDVEALQKAILKAQADFQKIQRKATERLAQQDFNRPFRNLLLGQRGVEPRLGARVEPLGAALAEQLGVEAGKGLVLADVPADSAAAKAGLKVNDVLLEVAGKPVSGKPDELTRQLDAVKPDAKVDLVVLRKGKKETLKGVTLPEAPLGFFPPAEALALRGIGNFPTITSQRMGDRFSTRIQEGRLTLTVTGRIDGDKVKVGEVIVNDGRNHNVYDGLDKVPEQYRDRAKQAVEVTEKGVLRLAPKP